MLEAMCAWVVDNKEWLFSGVGVVLVSWVGRILFKRMQTSSTQIIRSGDRSNNVQAGRDVSMGTKKNGNDVGEK